MLSNLLQKKQTLTTKQTSLSFIHPPYVHPCIHIDLQVGDRCHDAIKMTWFQHTFTICQVVKCSMIALRTNMQIWTKCVHTYKCVVARVRLIKAISRIIGCANLSHILNVMFFKGHTQLS